MNNIYVIINWRGTHTASNRRDELLSPLFNH